MNNTQKIIKYSAMAFALLLTFSIIMGIANGLISLGKIFDNNNEKYIEAKFNNLDIDNDITSLNIETTSTSIYFKKSDIFKAESNDKNIIVKSSNNKLIIKNKNDDDFNHKNSKLILYIPEDFIFDNITASCGAGIVDIEQISVKKLELELGFGKATINNITVFDEAEIEGGAGNITINNASFKELEFKLGVGKLSFYGTITDNSKFDCGIGKVDIRLTNNKDIYKFYVEKGIGEIKIDGTSLSDNSTYGSGDNKIAIEGGVGDINVEFIDNGTTNN